MIAQELSSTQSPSLPRAEVLNAIRRLDWRFLLPDPALGRVLVVGEVGGDLLAALRTGGVTVTMGEAVGAESALFDTAVAVNPSPRALAMAAALLRSGGWLYAEMNGGRAARRLAKQLPQMGFVSVRRHWHWPDFARCTRILPLDDAGALVYGLLKGQGGARSKTVTLLARGGVFLWLARPVSVVAQRGER